VKQIVIPKSYNYIGIFLTFACNYRCSYCINYFEQDSIKRKTISGEDWVKGLNRIASRDDLPVTLQGGEPSLHPDFIYIINNIKLELNIDILTNLQFDIDEFIGQVSPDRVKRDAPYASIRVSYHPEQMNLDDTIKRTKKMIDAGFSVGIWAVLHSSFKKEISEAKIRCEKLGIDFRTKEFLGEHNGGLNGTYKYDGACDKSFRKSVECKASELLLDSKGNIFCCHSDLYAGANPIGHILDQDFEIEDRFRSCDNFGHCNPCDMKVKTNRFQEFGHTSCEVKFI